MTWLISSWRSNSSTLSTSWMTELLTISKGKGSHPLEKAHFCCLYLGYNHLPKSEMKFWGHQTGSLPVQRPPEMSLTKFNRCRPNCWNGCTRTGWPVSTCQTTHTPSTGHSEGHDWMAATPRPPKLIKGNFFPFYSFQLIQLNFTHLIKTFFPSHPHPSGSISMPHSLRSSLVQWPSIPEIYWPKWLVVGEAL